MDPFEQFMQENQSWLVPYFQKNYMVDYKSEYTAWDLEDRIRFKEFCLGKFKRKAVAA